DLHARAVHEEGVEILRVAAVRADAEFGAHDERRAENAVGLEVDAGFRPEHAHGERGELGEHQFEHRPATTHGRAKRDRSNGFFGYRRIENAAGILVVFPETLERLQRTAHRADVLTEH